jgi:hypothetical protein
MMNMHMPCMNHIDVSQTVGIQDGVRTTDRNDVNSMLEALLAQPLAENPTPDNKVHGDVDALDFPLHAPYSRGDYSGGYPDMSCRPAMQYIGHFHAHTCDNQSYLLLIEIIVLVQV